MMSSESIRDAIAAHRDELVSFVRKRAPNGIDAEDVVHLAATRALAASPSLRDPSRVRAWLFRITRNTLTDQVRARRPIEPVRDDVASEPPRSQPCSCGLALSKSLRPDYAALLERAVLDEVPVAEVARELGITPNHASVKLHRARAALRDAVLAHCGTTSMAECMECTC